MFKKKRMHHGRKLVISTDRKSIVAEQIRTVRANIKFAMKDKECKTLLVTSTSIGEGKSTIASNIAISFAQEGQKVLLVDADLRKPTMHYTFNKPVSPGLTNFLMSNWCLSNILKDSGVVGLDLITCGPMPSNPAELLGSSTMNIFLEETISLYDLIIFDAPPLLSVADAQILSAKCDGTILVTSSGTTEKRNLYKVKEVLEVSNANVLGLILNHFKLEKNHYYYEYYGEKD
ncbi:CpsD/CapB family tyrosine-protein kinase [Psychrobacillus psychrodurans]|uniref:CpsD/CapB family tyrosine-protein kinase n=1 Tax=Psychrobacillus psychrodurans TaxID=126157 RepID=UPI0008EA98CB|nr:CpsD/CapB family tyrosine-protein kinase [Psychrobacillus psychrodurans]MCZ8540345.1 CpsD/CapB family tyrosine-protein kinase [Psychrobacillus psychrodurans]SFM60002.1 capsular exopolysaccharide family [Psychrobacillus psychrodurans]